MGVQRNFKNKMREEGWKFGCQQQWLARPDEESTGKLVGLLVFAKQDTHVSLKPTNLREIVWKELYIKIMKTTVEERESIH